MNPAIIAYLLLIATTIVVIGLSANRRGSTTPWATIVHAVVLLSIGYFGVVVFLHTTAVAAEHSSTGVSRWNPVLVVLAAIPSAIVTLLLYGIYAVVAVLVGLRRHREEIRIQQRSMIEAATRSAKAASAAITARINRAGNKLGRRGTDVAGASILGKPLPPPMAGTVVGDVDQSAMTSQATQRADSANGAAAARLADLRARWSREYDSAKDRELEQRISANLAAGTTTVPLMRTLLTLAASVFRHAGGATSAFVVISPRPSERWRASASDTKWIGAQLAESAEHLGDPGGVAHAYYTARASLPFVDAVPGSTILMVVCGVAALGPSSLDDGTPAGADPVLSAALFAIDARVPLSEIREAVGGEKLQRILDWSRRGAP